MLTVRESLSLQRLELSVFRLNNDIEENLTRGSFLIADGKMSR